MTKPIADLLKAKKGSMVERFVLYWGWPAAEPSYKEPQRSISQAENDAFILFLRWLEKQPENSRTFTLEEVEQVAREAVANADMNEDDDCADFNAWWWANKLKELSK